MTDLLLEICLVRPTCSFLAGPSSCSTFVTNVEMSLSDISHLDSLGVFNSARISLSIRLCRMWISFSKLNRLVQIIDPMVPINRGSETSQSRPRQNGIWLNVEWSSDVVPCKGNISGRFFLTCYTQLILTIVICYPLVLAWDSPSSTIRVLTLVNLCYPSVIFSYTD